MDAYDTLFMRLLRGDIALEQEARTNLLRAGIATTLEGYRERVGYLRALDDILVMMDTIKEKLMENEK